MQHDPDPAARQDADHRQEGHVLDQRAQQIDPAGKHRLDRNAAQQESADADPGKAAPGDDTPADEGLPEVRPAGPKTMDMPPKEWTRTDEEVDESFPASDPPGNY